MVDLLRQFRFDQRQRHKEVRQTTGGGARSRACFETKGSLVHFPATCHSAAAAMAQSGSLQMPPQKLAQSFSVQTAHFSRSAQAAKPAGRLQAQKASAPMSTTSQVTSKVLANLNSMITDSHQHQRSVQSQ